MKKHYFSGLKKAVPTLYRSHFRKIVLLFYSLFFLLLCQAQGQEYATSKSSENEFAPVGALWHYSQWSFGDAFATYKTIESASEVTIGGKLCKKMVQVDRFYSDTMLTIDHYMYSEQGRVYFYAENEFHLLYDFSATAGDTLVLDYYQTYNGDPLLMIIDSTGTIDVSGEQRTIQYVTSGDGMLVEFASEVIDGIGGSFFMFPNYDGSSNGALRCYQDQQTDVWLNPYNTEVLWNHEDCDQVITSVDEPTSILDVLSISVKPNPAKAWAAFDYTLPGDATQATLTIANTMGSTVEILQVSGQQGQKLWDTRKIEPGVYIYTLKANSFSESGKIVISK